MRKQLLGQKRRREGEEERKERGEEERMGEELEVERKANQGK